MADVLELQYAVLGSMLTRPECVGEAVSLLTAEDFDTLATRGLFEAVSRLHFAGAPVDPVTVLREAGEDYAAAIQEVSGRSASDVPYYCGLLREEMQLRKVQSCAYDLVSAETLEAAGEVVDLLNSLFSLRRKVDVVHARDAALDFIQRLSRQERPEYISLGVDWLDSRLFLELGDLVLLGGNASSGKTLLSLQFARKLAERYRVGYFSLETGSKKLTDRLISHMGQISFNHIKNMELSAEEAKRAVSAARRLDRLSLDFVPSSSMSVQDIQAVTLSRRYQVIFVDYLQIVQSKGQTRYEQVTNVSIALHTLAQSHGVLVIALAQLGRPEKADGKAIPPSMSSFRESGQLEQDADVALLLWPSDMRDNSSSRMLKIGKNKDGERGTLELAFDGAMQTMSPLPEKETGVDVAAHYAATLREVLLGEAGSSWPENIQHTGYAGLDILPANMGLAELDAAPGLADSGAVWRLRELLVCVAADDAYDFAVIDMPPAFSLSARAALAAADEVIVPIKLDAFSIDGMAELLRQIASMQKINPGLTLAGVLITMWRNVEVVNQAEKPLRDSRVPVFGTAIRRTDIVDESTFQREPLHLYSPRSAASVDYRHLAEEYLGTSERGRGIG